MNDNLQTLMRGDFDQEFTLDSVFEIEYALAALQSLDKKSKWLDQLKKFRNKSMDEQASVIETRMNNIRGVILRTMKRHEPNEKTLHFPAVGKVSRRKSASNLEIIDEDALINFLDSKGLRDQVVKLKEVADRKAMKTLAGDLSEGQEVPGVIKHPSQEVLSVSFEKESEQSKTKVMELDEDNTDFGVSLDEL